MSGEKSSGLAIALLFLIVIVTGFGGFFMGRLTYPKQTETVVLTQAQTIFQTVPQLLTVTQAQPYFVTQQVPVTYTVYQPQPYSYYQPYPYYNPYPPIVTVTYTTGPSYHALTVAHRETNPSLSLRANVIDLQTGYSWSLDMSYRVALRSYVARFNLLGDRNYRITIQPLGLSTILYLTTERTVFL